MTLEEQMKLAEAGWSPTFDEAGNITGWSSPIVDFPWPIWSPIMDDNGNQVGWWLEGFVG